MGGIGGGHSTAASFSAGIIPEKVANNVLKIIEDLVGVEKKILK